MSFRSADITSCKTVRGYGYQKQVHVEDHGYTLLGRAYDSPRFRGACKATLTIRPTGNTNENQVAGPLTAHSIAARTSTQSLLTLRLVKVKVL